MNWTHCSRALVLGVLLVTVLGLVGAAAAVSTSGDAPDAAEVGDDVSMEVTLEDLFEEDTAWTLEGETELENATWDIAVRDTAGDRIDDGDISGPDFTQDLDSDDGAVEVTVSVEGEVPDLDSFDYENKDAENYEVIGLTKHVDDSQSTLASWEAHRFTADSGEARQAIDSAKTAVEESGSSEAQEQLDRAIGAYDDENFELAIDLAGDAQTRADRAGQTRQILLIGGAVVALLAVVGGGVYYYRKSQQSTHKLQ